MERIQEIDQFLFKCIEAGDFAGAVYLVAEGDRICALGACGHSIIEPEIRNATTRTIFDLASLTKPLITGMLFAQFVESGTLDPAEPISRLLPQFDINDRAISVGQLATHSSGLAAWQPLYIVAGEPA